MANNDVVELKITYKSCNQNSYKNNSNNNNVERQQHEKLKLLLAGTKRGAKGQAKRGMV